MIRLDKNKMVSAIVVHEIYKLTLEKEGREVADHRIRLIEKDFKIINVDFQIAKISAELRHKYKIPMADSIIAATAKESKAVCITDDIRMKQVKEIKVQWI
ncbi:MAG: PIN domain-containing protein [Nitrososphaeria archaeon]